MDNLKDLADKAEAVSKFVSIIGWTIIVLLICWYMLREGGPSINVTHRDSKGVLAQFFDPATATPVTVTTPAGKTTPAVVTKEGFLVHATSGGY